MSGSSFALEGTFQGVRLSRICSLAALLAESEGPDYAWVKRRFGERETNYEETMAFVVAVGLKDVRPARKRAGDGTTWARDGERALARTVVDRLVSTPTAFRDELRRYLRLFIVAGDSVVREFPAGVSEAEAAVRDFLIDLQLLRCDHHHRRYVLSERHLGLDFRQRSPVHGMT